MSAARKRIVRPKRTGAGVSAESSIPTPVRRLHIPRELIDFCLGIIEPIAEAEPNAAHRAIARLERSKEVVVITQDIDGLHQRASNGT